MPRDSDARRWATSGWCGHPATAVELEVAGTWRIPLPEPHFAPTRWPFVLLGRADFLSHFVATFDQAAGHLTLERRP
jgi:hypothetical protein